MSRRNDDAFMPRIRHGKRRRGEQRDRGHFHEHLPSGEIVQWKGTQRPPLAVKAERRKSNRAARKQRKVNRRG